MKIRYVLFIAMTTSATVSGQSLPQLPCAERDQACVARAMDDHVAQRIATWKSAFLRPPAQRIGPAPPELVEYVTLDNILNGIAQRPRAAKLDAALAEDVRAAVAELPARIWKLVDERFVGVYFVRNLGGTGYTDYVRDPAGRNIAAFIVLDADVLGGQRANAWATWKENTPFMTSADYELTARIETEAGDDRKNAIRYILLHELGHVLSVGAGIHPPWNIRPKDLADEGKYPFFELSWSVDRTADRYRSHFDAAFPQRVNTVYYFGAKLSAADMVPTYANLRQTNFPSLYAATRPGDDFAESFASYVHVVLMRRPWQITIAHKGKVVDVLTSCWGERRCAKKQAILERILNGDR